ncbi:hypothetical protein [Mucilaginibacter sp.]|uniref:pirin family protein n=1 Tax=Mucilaginibacter sp. TaxID=1882438 RepID=UPI003266DF6B
MSITLSPAKIFLADQRGFAEDAVQQCSSTFSFGDFKNADKEPFGNLYTLNDEILSAGSSITQQAKYNSYLVLLPITGGIIYCDNTQHFETDAGEVLVVPMEKGTEFKIANPYPANWVNYIRIEIKSDDLNARIAESFTFDLEQFPNQLIPVVGHPGCAFKMLIGRFGGREEVVYRPVGKTSKVFSFVISGAFELQNRLLHEQDGLALWDADIIEAEALSNNAILLLIDLK